MKTCLDCGKPISKGSAGRCRECGSKYVVDMAARVAAYSGRISINTPNTPFFAMIAVVIRCGRYRQHKSGWRGERKIVLDKYPKSA